MLDSKQSLRIGQVADAAGVTVEAVRFYEKEGLLPKARRRPSGYRSYSGDAVRRISFIQAAQYVGFRLHEIGDLLALRVRAGRGCAEVKARAEAKLEELRARRIEIARMEGALERLVQTCESGEPTGSCPLLDALDTEGQAHAGG